MLALSRYFSNSIHQLMPAQDETVFILLSRKNGHKKPRRSGAQFMFSTDIYPAFRPDWESGHPDNNDETPARSSVSFQDAAAACAAGIFDNPARQPSNENFAEVPATVRASESRCEQGWKVNRNA
ncbi:hypothetical protein HA38_16875 [Pantoea allii]|nr:hypothetical protein HA38_16875 [Pantoea allii]